jgi:hypothetical protein
MIVDVLLDIMIAVMKIVSNALVFVLNVLTLQENVQFV